MKALLHREIVFKIRHRFSIAMGLKPVVFETSKFPSRGESHRATLLPNTRSSRPITICFDFARGIIQITEFFFNKVVTQFCQKETRCISMCRVKCD
jgi:hypothetical protein